MTRIPIAERLERLSMPEPNSGCVLWLGMLDQKGYSRFSMWADRWIVSGYVAAYITFVGPIPEGMVLDHLCRNHACIAVEHLEPVTHRVNLMRGQTVAARNAAKTACLYGHPLDAANTYVRPDGHGRHCRTCQRERDARREARRRTPRGFQTQAAAS